MNNATTKTNPAHLTFGTPKHAEWCEKMREARAKAAKRRAEIKSLIEDSGYSPREAKAIVDAGGL